MLHTMNNYRAATLLQNELFNQTSAVSNANFLKFSRTGGWQSCREISLRQIRDDLIWLKALEMKDIWKEKAFVLVLSNLTDFKEFENEEAWNWWTFFCLKLANFHFETLQVLKLISNQVSD